MKTPMLSSFSSIGPKVDILIYICSSKGEDTNQCIALLEERFNITVAESEEDQKKRLQDLPKEELIEHMFNKIKVGPQGSRRFIRADEVNFDV